MKSKWENYEVNERTNKTTTTTKEKKVATKNEIPVKQSKTNGYEETHEK